MMKNLFLLSFLVVMAVGQMLAQSETPKSPEEIKAYFESNGFASMSVTIQEEAKRIDCNDAQAIRGYLEKNGFESSPVTIVGTAEKMENSMVKDFAQLIVLDDGLKINLAQALQKDVKAGASEGFNVVAIVTKNENFCDQSIQQIIYNDFDKSNYDTSINAHIWDNPDGTGDLLFIRFNQVDLDK